MDTLLFYVENGGNAGDVAAHPFPQAQQLDLMLGQQGDVLLCHAPIPPYTVKAAYQHHIHLSGKNGLHHLLQSQTVKGHSRAMLGGSTNDGVPGLFRIAAKLLGLPFQRKAIIVSDAAIEIGFHRVVPPIPQPVPGRS